MERFRPRADRSSQLALVKPTRRGIALALVLATLVLAGALAAGAVMQAAQSMRDAAGSLERLRALAAAEQGLAIAASPAGWDTTWSAPGPPGLVALRSTIAAAVVDTTRVLRLTPATYLLLSESRTLSTAALSAHARLALLLVIDSTGHPVRTAGHAWTPMP